jgi:hypothetical protein
MGRLDCGELADIAAELALGAVTGRERAEAVAHLDRCAACRERVGRLMVTEERLVGLLPGADPPSGFEARVAERTGPAGQDPGPGPGPRRRLAPEPGGAGRIRRLLAAAVITLAAAIAGLGTGWGMRGAGPPTAGAGALLSSAVLLSASRHPAGTVFAYRGSPPWLYMSVDLPRKNGTVICQVIGKGRHVTDVGSFRLTDGYGDWGSPVPAVAGPLADVRLISPGGAVLATASFSRR